MKALLLLLLLASGVAYLSWPRRPAAPVTRITVPTRSAANTSSSHSPAWFRELPPREKFATPWAALTAGDHPAFIALLREAGCPEETVRTFGFAALGRIHQQHLEAPLREAVQTSKYWRHFDWSIFNVSADARTALNRDITQLLGISADELRRAYSSYDSQRDLMIPEAQQTAFAELSARHQAEQRALHDSLPRGAFGQLFDGEARAQLRQLRDRQRQELVELLGPQLAEQYELQFSVEADYVRTSLPAAKNEGEFRRMMAAAQAVGVDNTDASVDQIQVHLPAPTRKTFSLAQDEVLARFREDTDPQRLAEFEQEQAETQRQEKARQQAEREAASLADLAATARAGGVELTDAEVRKLATAIRQRGEELDREWGQPPTKPTPAEATALKERLKAEFERVAVATIGERGRALVKQMVKEEQSRQP